MSIRGPENVLSYCETAVDSHTRARSYGRRDIRFWTLLGFSDFRILLKIVDFVPYFHHSLRVLATSCDKATINDNRLEGVVMKL